MHTDRQQQLYNAFYKSTHDNQYLDTKTELRVGLAAAYAMNCAPCSAYYLKQAQKADITQCELQEDLANVLAVAAGQKRLQVADVYSRYKIATSTNDMSN